VPEHNDRMTTTLEALRSDVERTPLADSVAVRRRGDQRTRRQAVGGALVVAALVAGAVGYLTGGLTGDNQGLPPATSSPTATSSPSPTGASAGPLVTDVPDQALMTADDLGVAAMAPLEGGSGIETLNPCLLGSDDAVSVGRVVYGPQADDIAASQVIITQSDATGAANQLAGFASDMLACEERLAQGPADGSTVKVTPGDFTPAQQGALGEEAWVFRIRVDQSSAAGTTRAYAIGFRTRNATAVLAFRSPEFAIAERTMITAIAARDRMAAVYGS
jgi:hypothetical protein